MEVDVKIRINNSLLVENYAIREELLNNRPHIIVPVVMLVEGVHNGSRGPILYTEDEISESPTAWNGVPVTINHPNRNNGENRDKGYDNTVGEMRNVKFHEHRLIGEAWLDISLMEEKSPEALQSIRNHEPLDVSTGFNSAYTMERGVFNNEEYNAIVSGIEPDHLALLPGSQGACSWDDGCGIRNEQNEQNEFIGKLFKTKGEGGPMKTENKEQKKTIDLAKVHNGLSDVENEAGFRAISNMIQSRLDALDTNLRMNFLEEVFDDYFIYRVTNVQDRSNSLYKVNYQITDNDEVEFDNSQAVEVRKVVTFEALEERSPKFRRKEKPISNKKGGNTMSKNQKGSPCKVSALISNEATKFTEDDREWLETLEDGALDKLTPEDTKGPKVENTKEPVVEEVNEDKIKEILNKTDDPVKFIDNFMPAALGKQMKEGLRMYENKRNTIIDEIVENSKFTKEQLQNWEDSDLDALHGSVVKEEVDYSINNLGRKTVSNQNDAVLDDVAVMFNLESDSEK